MIIYDITVGFHYDNYDLMGLNYDWTMILKGFSGDLEGAKAAKEIGVSIFHHISYETGRNGELWNGVFQSHDSLVGFTLQ